MKRFYPLLLLFFTLAACAFAQSPSISISTQPEVCVNTPVKVNANVSGLFSQSNLFKARLRRNNLSDYVEIPATFENQQFTFTVPRDRVELRQSYEIQIVASSPATVSNWASYITFHAKDRLILANTKTDTVNKYREFGLLFQTHSSSSGIATLMDSSKIWFDALINPEQLNSMIKYRYPQASTTYTIAHAENFCGAMEVAGQARAYVNPVSIGTSLVTPHFACLGSEIRVNFKIDHGTLPANGNYKLRIVQAGPYPEPLTPDSYELPATFSNGQVVATIPDNIPLTNPTFFKVAVLIPNAGVVGSYGDVGLRISPRPHAEIISQSRNVQAGEAFSVGVRYTGPNPYVIRLNDGSTMSGTWDVMGEFLLDVTRYPTVSTDYFIKSIETVCEPAPLSTKKVTATVTPGLLISIPEDVARFCEGAKVRLPFSATIPLQAGTTFQMSIASSGEKLIVPAARIGSEIEFTVPQFNDALVDTQGRPGDFTFQLLSENPGLQSNRITKQSVLGKPQITWTPNEVKVAGPGPASASYRVTGGGPYDITSQLGASGTIREWQTSSSADFFVRQSGDFGLRSVGNACFINQDLPKVRLSVTDPNAGKPVLAPSITRTAVCRGDSLEIDVRTAGNFGSGNEFRILLSQRECCEYEVVKTVYADGKVRIALPYDDERDFDGKTSYYVKVSATNPEILSSSFDVSVHQPAGNFTVTNTSDGHLYDITPRATLRSEGGPVFELTYTNGKQDFTVKNIFPGLTTYFDLPVKTGENKFAIKSITSACRTEVVNLPFKINIHAYRLRLPVEMSHQKFCIGNTMRVPFGVLNGEAPNARFFLQFSKYNEAYVTVGETTGRVFEYKIGEGQTGAYKMRVTSSDSVSTGDIPFDIGSAPSATITPRDVTGTPPYELKPWQTVYIDIAMKGAVPIWLMADGIDEYQRLGLAATAHFTPVAAGTYTIQFLTNNCGPGTVDGSFAYKVKPGLMLIPPSEAVCRDQGLLINYDLAGDADLSKDFIYFTITNIRTKLTVMRDSTRVLSGPRRFTLPGNLPPGHYTIKAFVPKYELSAMETISIIAKPTVSLIGPTTINTGGSTNLMVKSAEEYNGQSIKFTISNGFSGEFSPSAGDNGGVTVSPAATTTYSITAVSNACGAGTVTGSNVPVTVNPPSAKTVQITRWSSTRFYNGFCAGDEIKVEYTTTGTFSADNRFTLQISDSTGRNFRAIPTVAEPKSLTAVIPADLPRATGYRIRIAASDAGVASADFRGVIFLQLKSTAKFTSETVGYNGIDTPMAEIVLTGDMPVSTVCQAETGTFAQTSFFTTDSLPLYMPAPGREYTIKSVSNVCGPGTVLAPATVRIEVITGSEPTLPAVVVFPNPTREFVTLNFAKSGKYNVYLYDIAGKQLASYRTSEEALHLDLRKYPAGILILNVESGKKKSTFRIIRQ
jgi:hypothetical protein